MNNWRTTLSGLGIGILNLLANGATPKQIGLSLGFSVLGLLAKDSNVSNAPNPLPQGQPVNTTR